MYKKEYIEKRTLNHLKKRFNQFNIDLEFLGHSKITFAKFLKFIKNTPQNKSDAYKMSLFLKMKEVKNARN